MRSIYKRILIILTMLIVLCGVIGTNYLFYDKSIGHEMFVEADGELSINYIKSKKIKKDGSYEFSVTNNSDKDFYYEIAIEKRKNYNPETTFNIKSTEANIDMNHINMDKDKLTLVDNILITSKTTQTFIITIDNLKNMKFDLVVHKNNDTEEYFFAQIIKDNEIKKDTLTKIGEEIAFTNEGLIEEADDLGISYYFRGNVINNYVKLADKLWRIIRINGDGSVRLILDSATSELTSYHKEVSKYEDYLETTIYETLQTYYENNLKNHDKIIANTKFCSENGSIEANNEKVYNAYTRLITNKIPTLNCLGTKVSSKIGLITADEVIFAGATNKEENKNYYLYNSKVENNWWTSSLAKNKNNSFYPFTVNLNGKLSDEVSGTSYRDLRPVINIIKKVTVTGTGTIDDPYLINE